MKFPTKWSRGSYPKPVWTQYHKFIIYTNSPLTTFRAGGILSELAGKFETHKHRHNSTLDVNFIPKAPAAELEYYLFHKAQNTPTTSETRRSDSTESQVMRETPSFLQLCKSLVPTKACLKSTAGFTKGNRRSVGQTRLPLPRRPSRHND